MTVTIEAFGPARTLIGGPSARIEVAGPLTVRSALAAAAARHPRLVGAVLRDEHGTPLENILVNLDGRRFLHDLDEALPDDSHLVLLPALAGGAAGRRPGERWHPTP